MRGAREVDWPRALLAGLVIVVGVSLLYVAATSAAAFSPYNPSWDGATDLRPVAESAGAEPTLVRETGRYDDAESETVAVVVAPDEPYGANDTAHVRAFVERGGTLVVADDVDGPANALLAGIDADARIDGRPLRDEYRYESAPSLPHATNVSSHPLGGDVDRLTLNYATVVEPNGADVVVASSDFAYLDTNRDGALDEREEPRSRPVVTAEDVGDGRVIVVSDPSIFINAMLERSDNEVFARNLVDGHERALFDVSHADELPPLALAVLTLREEPTIAVLAGLFGIAASAVVADGRLLERLRGRSSIDGSSADAVVSDAELAAYLRERHPDWDDSSVLKIASGINTPNEEHESDE